MTQGPLSEHQALLDHLADGIVVLQGGRICLATVPAAELLGFSPTRLVGSPIESCLPPEAQHIVKRIEEGAASCTCRDVPWGSFGAAEHLCLRGTAGPEPGEVLLVVSRGASPKSPATAASFRRRLEWLDHLAAGMAHEIRNPLGGIRGAAQLLSRNPDSEDRGELLRLIVYESDRIDRLVERLMSLTRPRRLQLSRVDLNRIVHDEVSLLRAQYGSEGVSWNLELDPSLPAVEGDPERIREAIGNLLRNAYEAGGCTIGVHTRVDREGRLVEEGFERGLTLEVEVTDNGPGIPQEQVSNLFVPFATTKRAGSGLGLFVARLASQDHGGRLDVDPRPGLGARFTLALSERLPPRLTQPADTDSDLLRLTSIPLAPSREMLN